jgi:hypothetical protein
MIIGLLSEISRPLFGVTWHQEKRLMTVAGPSQKDLRRNLRNYCQKPVSASAVLRSARRSVPGQRLPLWCLNPDAASGTGEPDTHECAQEHRYGDNDHVDDHAVHSLLNKERT